MQLDSFITASDICGIETYLDYKIFQGLSGKIVIGLPLETSRKEDNLLLLPYLEFFDYIINNSYTLAAFFYAPEYLYLLFSIKTVKRLAIISPLQVDLGISWLKYSIIGFNTTIVYDNFYYLGSKNLIKNTVKRAAKLSKTFSRILIVAPNQAFLTALLPYNERITLYSPGENHYENISAVVENQAILAANVIYPDCIIHTCQSVKLFPGTMGGYYDKLVYSSKEDCEKIARLSSLRENGFCLRMISADNYERFVSDYLVVDYIPYTFIRNNPTYLNVSYEDEVLQENFLDLPLSVENNKVFSLWLSKNYPAFSLLGPLVLMNNFSSYLFTYPLLIYKSTSSYLTVCGQHYKTFFSKFKGKDSLETLCKIWETMLQDVGSFTPSYDEVKVWADNNSLSADKLWSALNVVQSCVEILGKKGIKVEKGPSDSKKVQELAAPLFAKVYEKRIMFRGENSLYEHDLIRYKINTFLLPSNLGISEEEKKIVGLILSDTSVIAGISI